MKYLKELLLSNIENTADWRVSKALEYPDDAVRNDNCSEALRELHTHVEALPDDHALWRAMKKCVDYGVDLYSIGEEESYMISHFGFYLSPLIDGRQFILNSDPDEFVRELTALYEKAANEAEINWCIKPTVNRRTEPFNES